MRTLLIDNYDSFTGNLYQLVWMVTGSAPVVIANDHPDFDGVMKAGFDAIVISPGPGRPERTRDFGVSARAIQTCDLPILGVCLGHQGLCHLFGGTIAGAPEVMHGRKSAIFHAGEGLFAQIPSPFLAVRYHSLVVTEVPPSLETIAWTEDDLCMAVRHRERPLWGVQFHPESIGTEHGQALFENFFRLSRRSAAKTTGPIDPPPENAPFAPAPTLTLHTRSFPSAADGESVFSELFARSDVSVWLDSAMRAEGLSRFSFLADASGPQAEVLTCDVRKKTVTTTSKSGTATRQGSLFDTLSRELEARRAPKAALPFDFQGGYIGYLGYELKAECGGDDAWAAETPDAKLLFADRVVVLDHDTSTITLLCLSDADTREEGERWLDETARRLARLGPAKDREQSETPTAITPEKRHSEGEYLALVARCQDEIEQGESYEVCLTNQLRVSVHVDPVETYFTLRHVSPAPFAALLRFGALAVLSASPERFLKVSAEGDIEARPIKGTAPRGLTPESDEALRDGLQKSEKDRAENLMIVDLLRNDLGQVCERGSVHVPHLFAVESYAAVHQLVSTVRGKLKSGVSAVDAARAAFPGGSMTGAPKKRTMEILDRLEAGPRGVYSGALGYFSRSGAADLNIVIRTIVATKDAATIGVGGAVVSLSTPEGELEETKLKARAALEAIARAHAERQR